MIKLINMINPTNMTNPTNKQHLQPTKQHCQEGSERKKQTASYCQHLHFMKSSNQYQTLHRQMSIQLEYPLFHTPTLSPTKEEMITRRSILESTGLRSYQTKTPVQGHERSRLTGNPDELQIAVQKQINNNLLALPVISVESSRKKETLEHIVEEDDAYVQKIVAGKIILHGILPAGDGIPFKLAVGSNVRTVLSTKEIFDQNLLYFVGGNVFAQNVVNDYLRIPLISNQNGTFSAAAQAAGSDAVASDGTHSDDLSSLNPTEQNKSSYAQKKYDGRNKRLRYYGCNNIVLCWLPLFFILCCGVSMVEGVDPLLDRGELTSAINTYQDTATISKYGPIENWDVSRVTSLSMAFKNKGTFNADLSKWNVSSVTSLSRSKCSDLKCSPPFFFSFHI
jgi:hypothetical protein